MAVTPVRPIRYLFKLGKGNVKGRRESENPFRAVVEQFTLAYAENNWEKSRRELADAIQRDVRAELVYVAGQFRRNVIGAPGNQRGLVGTLGFRLGGEGGQSKQSLGGLPRWAPRGAAYLERKGNNTGHQNWFDNSGWEPGGGTLAKFFGSKTEDQGGGTSVNVGSGGILEEIFGGVSVQIIRNNRGWGVNKGTMKVGRDGHAELQMATIRVRALGAVTESMMKISDSPNDALLGQIGRHSAQASIAALHLRGGRGRYRPTLEPYLRFFLERSVPHAVTRRIAAGTASGRLFRKSSQR